VSLSFSISKVRARASASAARRAARSVAQHCRQRHHIVGNGIIGAHRRQENHNTPAQSELSVVLSI
jgi:hypothetical protein